MNPIADKYEAIRRILTPIRNREKDEPTRVRMSTLIENCTAFMQAESYLDEQRLGTLFEQNLSDFENYVSKRGKYAGG